MPASTEEIISRLLDGAVEVLDIPTQLHELAVARYEEVGTWLAKTGGDGWEIYPQGSFRLGTVVRPSAPVGEYDIDLVCWHDVAKESVTQAGLKETVGEMLLGYLQWKADEQPEGGPSECVSERRCWTLKYADHGFHMDVLPAIPDVDHPPTSILLTDVNLRAWQHSNPIGYAAWFRGRSEELLRKLAELAREANVAEVPEWRVRTTLQRLVQVLKWHCALRFADDLDDRPPSILLTTLAARAYSGEEDLFTAALDAVWRMPELVESRAGMWWVPNPVHEQENFADKWNEYPLRRVKFFGWLSEITQVLDELGRMRGEGLDRVVKRLEESFAAGPIRKSARRLGEETRGLREAGALAMSSTGMLAKTGAVKVPGHTFYGDSVR